VALVQLKASSVAGHFARHGIKILATSSANGCICIISTDTDFGIRAVSMFSLVPKHDLKKKVASIFAPSTRILRKWR
jgi:hypothetical protein